MPHADPEARAAYLREYRAKNTDTTAYERVKRKRVRQRQLLRAAKQKPCADCGVQYPSYVMDFDHVRSTKLFNLSTCTNTLRGVQAIEDEIAKCDVVCANCHRLRHPPEV